MGRGLKIALGALVLAAAVWFGVTTIVRAYVFKNSDVIVVPVWQGTPPVEASVTTADGMTLQGYYWAPAGAKDILVLFHGNGNNQQGVAPAAEAFTHGGHGVLVASYRGFGGNPGSPSQTGLFADGDAWMALARKLLPPGGKLYVLGRSLGSGVAMEMAARHPVDGLATVGGYTSITDMAPWIARPFVLDPFDNVAAIRRVQAPIVLFHGDKDPIIPFACAPKLRDASGGRAKLVVMHDWGHSIPPDVLAPLLWGAFGR